MIWDKNGTLLETGNKYSIYNDGDFYYLEVHHVSNADAGFYNCIATNLHGMAVVSCDVEVTASEQAAQRRRKDLKVPMFIEVLPGTLQVRIEEM